MWVSCVSATSTPMSAGLEEFLSSLQLDLTLPILHIVGGGCSAVGIATCYGLDGPGIESRWEQDFHGYRVFPGVKAAEAWR